jgi:hypothetical protein
MCPSRRLRGLLFAALSHAVLLAGEVASQSAPAVPAPPPPAASPAVPLPMLRAVPAERMVSPRVAELLAAATPKFQPQPAPPPGRTLPPASSLTPGEIIQLAPVLVESSRLRLPDEVQSLSADGLAAELRKSYPGASTKGQDPYQIGHGRPNYARLMYEGDRNVREKASLENLADLMERSGDRTGSARLKREIQGAFGGGYKDPLAEAMEKSANGGRR